MSSDPVIRVRNLSKTFTRHNQGGVTIPVFAGLDLDVPRGWCVCLRGSSGAGKSTLMRLLYANYRPTGGHIHVRHRESMVDLATAAHWTVLDVRRRTISYVSQFLRVIPRVSALSIVEEQGRLAGVDADTARDKARDLLARLRVAPRLWELPPATFSGGEQQRVNIARGLMADSPILLLDEPTASLDRANRDTVIELMKAAKQRGVAIVGIFHDEEVRDALADTTFDVEAFRTPHRSATPHEETAAAAAPAATWS